VFWGLLARGRTLCRRVLLQGERRRGEVRDGPKLNHDIVIQFVSNHDIVIQFGAQMQVDNPRFAIMSCLCILVSALSRILNLGALIAAPQTLNPKL